jgi:hypothetical protein
VAAMQQIADWLKKPGLPNDVKRLPRQRSMPAGSLIPRQYPRAATTGSPR